jgi:hypothetical protein
MLHGDRAVPPDLFSKALGLLIEGVAATDRKRPLFARMCPKAAVRADRRGAAEHRRLLLAGLSGRVVALGAGNGLNFAQYPTTVTDVVTIEPEAQPPSRRRSDRAARRRERHSARRHGRLAAAGRRRG